jgi:TIR domain/inactive STAND
MSADIFISYRRGGADSWAAGRLYDRLQKEFSTYFDTSRESNDLGDKFAEGIDRALASCRVVFAVIGPRWTSEEGLDRLKDPRDWVRRELAIAFSRPDVRVIPLYVEKVKPPDESVLPEELKALAGNNGRPLDPDDWDAEVTQLVSRLGAEWLAVRRRPAVAAPSVPPMLPYLCDRREQEDGLVDLIQSATVPLACVVHGHKWEAHDEFLDRLRQQKALEDLLDAHEEGIAVRAIQLSRDRMREGRHRDALLSALKAAVLRRRTASDTELRAYFLKLSQPLIAVVQLTSADLETEAGNPIENLVRAWSGLLRGEPDQPPQGSPAETSPTWAALLWINVTYDDIGGDLALGPLVPALPRLQPVESVHIREWLGLDDVKPLVAHKKSELEDLAEQSRYCFEPGRIHMRTFATAVRDILAGG